MIVPGLPVNVTFYFDSYIVTSTYLLLLFYHKLVISLSLINHWIWLAVGWLKTEEKEKGKTYHCLKNTLEGFSRERSSQSK